MPSPGLLSNRSKDYGVGGQTEFPELRKIRRMASCGERKYFKDSNCCFDNKPLVKTTFLCWPIGIDSPKLHGARSVTIQRIAEMCTTSGGYHIRLKIVLRIAYVLAIFELPGKNPRGRSFTFQRLQFGRTGEPFIQTSFRGEAPIDARPLCLRKPSRAIPGLMLSGDQSNKCPA
jgi:hypothetical protein